MRSRRAGSSEAGSNVWPGFTDIMVGLLLVFVLVVTLFTISETILSRTLSKKDKELLRLHDEISQKTEKMESLAKEIGLQARELEKLRAEIVRLEKLFETQVEKTVVLEKLLTARTEELGSVTADLLRKSALLEEKEKAFAEESKKLETALADVRDKSARLLEQDTLMSGQRQEIRTALSDLTAKTVLLQEKEKLASDLGLQLTDTKASLAKAEDEIKKKSAAVTELTATMESLNSRIAALNKKIAEYVEQVNRLNGMVSEAKEGETAEKTKASALQKEIASLTSKLDEISKRLAKAKEDRDKQFRMAKLVNLLGEKDKEIDRLRKLAKYRSEFLAKLEEVFSGVSDIKVQGDRFVFQSEILFDSGSAEINETGKKELDKFIKIYKEMVPKIPVDIPLLILVQGHTDIVPVRSSRYRSNWELSSARAMQVVRYMIDEGIPPTRLGASALGEFHPAAKGATPQDRRLNRRIEIKITTL